MLKIIMVNYGEIGFPCQNMILWYTMGLGILCFSSDIEWFYMLNQSHYPNFQYFK